jgi:hypothetical protein
MRRVDQNGSRTLAGSLKIPGSSIITRRLRQAYGKGHEEEEEELSEVSVTEENAQV